MSNPGPASQVDGNSQPLQSNQAVRLLGVAQGVNLNVVGDTFLPAIGNPAKFSVTQAILTNASTSLTTAAASIYPQPAAAGTAIVSNVALSAATGATVVKNFTINSTAVQSGTGLYFHVGTAQGAAATADVYVYGYDLTIS